MCRQKKLFLRTAICNSCHYQWDDICSRNVDSSAGSSYDVGRNCSGFPRNCYKISTGFCSGNGYSADFSLWTNALLLGFLIAAAVNIISIFALGASGLISVALIPLMVACYFDVAPACIFANKRGGIKAVITTAIIGGFILTVLCAISIPMVSSTVGTFLQVYGGNEYSVWVIIADALAKLLSVIGL